MKKIGILGGTLNPIHLGHLMIAEEAYEELQLEKVLFMPSGCPPHKNLADISSNDHRANMVSLAIEGNSHFGFSDFEMKREGVIYTSDTLKLLREANPDTEYYFIMGADSLLYFDKWHLPEEILKNAVIVVADRDFSSERIREYADMLKKKYDICDIRFINSPNISISSSDIRKRIQDGKSVRYLVGENVEKYILKNELYK